MKLTAAIILTVITTFGSAVAALGSEREITLPGVALREGVTVDLSLTVLTNPHRRVCVGPSLFAVHGLAHTAATWKPLVAAIFEDRGLSHVCRAILIDLPGHGRSGLPVGGGVTFGDLTLDDYVTAVIAALDSLPRHERPQVIVGHSMGGIIVQMVQERLLEGGTSLARRFGIFAAVLLSTTRSREAPWLFADSGQAAATVGSLVAFDPVRGLVVRFPLPVWLVFFFFRLGTPELGFVASTPSIEDVIENGYSNDEALAAGVQLVGIPGVVQRPSVRPGAFARRHGTALIMNGMSQDPFAPLAEMEATYVHLTGDERLIGYAPIVDDDAVHDMHVAQPARFLRLMRTALVTHF